MTERSVLPQGDFDFAVRCAGAPARAGEARLTDYVILLKPRVMALVIFTAAVGLLVAPSALHPIEALAAIIFIAMGAGASGALNMWWDADIDRLMRRTQNRPIPAGRVSASEALGLGLGLALIAVPMLGLAANWLAAGLLAFTILFYVVIYTMWLKRSTPQNIVIGGAAGALPPVIGWAAATGSVGIEALLMFLLIFLWTPPHFWALALFVKGDYSRAAVPMLTETHGRRVTRAQIFLYSLLLAPAALALALTSVGGPIYLLVAVLLNGAFLASAFVVLSRTDKDSYADSHKAERALFRLSLVYLFGHFAALLAEATPAAAGLRAALEWGSFLSSLP